MVKTPMAREIITDRWGRRLCLIGKADGSIHGLAREAVRLVHGFRTSKRGNSRIFVTERREVYVIPEIRPEYDSWMPPTHRWWIGNYGQACTIADIEGDMLDRLRELPL